MTPPRYFFTRVAADPAVGVQGVKCASAYVGTGAGTQRETARCADARLTCGQLTTPNGLTWSSPSQGLIWMSEVRVRARESPGTRISTP